MCLKAFSTIFLFAKIRVNSSVSVPPVTLHFAILWHYGIILQNFCGLKTRLPTGSNEQPITKSENLATATSTCRPKLPVLIYSTPFVMSQNYKMLGCQWYGVKRMKIFCCA